MLSAASVFREIHDDDEAFRLFCSIAMQGESQGGWENGRIAELVPDQELAPKVARHGADEDKHGRIFRALLRKRGLEPADVPAETDYTMLLEHQGIGLTHARLREGEKLTEREVIVYLAHSRVTEQRASEQMRMLRRVFGDHPEIGKAVRMICSDEDNHLVYCHEELLRLGKRGYRSQIDEILRVTAHAEIRTYRDVSLAVMRHMGEILRWPAWKRNLLTAGIHGVYGFERVAGWRRMTSLRTPPPAMRDPLSKPRDRDLTLEY